MAVRWTTKLISIQSSFHFINHSLYKPHADNLFHIGHLYIIKKSKTAVQIVTTRIPARGDSDLEDMPFLTEGGPGASFSVGVPTPITLADLKNVMGSGSRMQKILPRESSQRRPPPLGKLMGSGSPNSSAALAAAAMNNFQSPSPAGDREASYVASRRARSNNFTLKETFDLLKVWASPEMQWQMKHNFRNFRVWEAISYSMSELGHDRTAIQCKNRIQNLTSIFYRIKKSKQDYRAFNFPYFKLIQDVLDGKKQGSSLGSLGLHAPSVNAYGQGLNPADFQGTNPSPPSSQGFGTAAHMALVEEYQHLINGQPEAYAAPPSTSPNSNEHLNVLSPEVSLSEGNSPIRVENQGSSTGGLRNGTNNHIKEEDERLDDEDGGSEFDEQLQEEDETSDPQDSVNRMRKRSFPATYSRVGFPTKRPRGFSGGSEGSGSDPVAQYLAEMVEIERGWLEMERERAENERQMMMYMMQILQALVSPSQGTEEDSEEGEDQSPLSKVKVDTVTTQAGPEDELKEDDDYEEPPEMAHSKLQPNGEVSSD